MFSYMQSQNQHTVRPLCFYVCVRACFGCSTQHAKSCPFAWLRLALPLVSCRGTQLGKQNFSYRREGRNVTLSCVCVCVCVCVCEHIYVCLCVCAYMCV